MPPLFLLIVSPLLTCSPSVVASIYTHPPPIFPFHTPPPYTSPMPRVLLNFQHSGNAWTVHFTEQDCRNTIGPKRAQLLLSTVICARPDRKSTRLNSSH